MYEKILASSFCIALASSVFLSSTSRSQRSDESQVQPSPCAREAEAYERFAERDAACVARNERALDRVREVIQTRFDDCEDDCVESRVLCLRARASRPNARERCHPEFDECRSRCEEVRDLSATRVPSNEEAVYACPGDAALTLLEACEERSRDAANRRRWAEEEAALQERWAEEEALDIQQWREQEARGLPNGPRGATIDMVMIPGGTFRMGSARGDDQSERPVTRVTLRSFWMDRTEVTVLSYAACVEAGRCERVLNLGDSCNWRMRDRDSHPMNCVSWNEARRYCSWIGKRLPTEAEWEYAARGRDGREYPWGNEAPNDTLLRWSGGCGRTLCVDRTSPVGSHPSGRSAFGLDDMSGNVYEWVNDWDGAYPGGRVTNPLGVRGTEERVYRGGSWGDVANQSVRAASRGASSPGSSSAGSGFRCAM